MDDDDFSDPPVVPIVIDGTLDLHHFSPRDLSTLIPEYLAECQQRSIRHVRLIHGKGKGVLRRSVHHLLQTSTLVESFRLADETGGGWGATLVRLKQREDERPSES